MPTQTSVGFVLNLDSSGSMQEAIAQVKIDAKAFVRQARPNDQFGINQFNNHASWIYPTGSSPSIVTVSGSLQETGIAAQAIQSDFNVAGTRTNLGEAIQIANPLIQQATTDVTGLVILSDGNSNTGPNPSTVLGSEPPIFVAGLGPHLTRSKFQPLLDKNADSRFYQQPNAYEMMKVFNDIRVLPSDAGATANEIYTYTGDDFVLTPFEIAEGTEEAQVSVVWSDSSYQYTSDYPSADRVNVQLIDPSGDTTSLQPQITDGGYCVFNWSGPQPGTWQVLAQYEVSSGGIYGTHGAFEFDTQVNMALDLPAVHSVGEPLTLTADLTDEGQPVEGVQLQARVRRPAMSLETAVGHFADDLEAVRPDPEFLAEDRSEDVARLLTLRQQLLPTREILPVRATHAVLEQGQDGRFTCILPAEAVQEAGSYSYEVRASGRNKATGRRFSRVCHGASLVG